MPAHAGALRPALVLEIVSEGTRGKDAVKKLDLYLSTGMREYWLVDPLQQEINVYFFADQNLTGNKTYRRGEAAASRAFPGLEAALDAVFA